MWAAEWSNKDKVRILLEHGADVNAQDNQGKLHAIIVTMYLSIYLYTFIPVDIFLYTK